MLSDHYDAEIKHFAAGESVLYALNCVPWLRGASIAGSSVAVAAADAGDITVDDNELDTATQVRFRLSGGAAGKTARLDVTVNTSTGDVLKARILVVVREA